MGTMFRSEEMVLCQLFVQSEAAYVSMYELGEAGVAQFRDVSTANSGTSTLQDKLLSMTKNKDNLYF